MADLADCVQKMCAQKCVGNYMRQGVGRRVVFRKVAKEETKCARG